LNGTNRDINATQEITRDQTTGMLDGSVTVDHRLLTEGGRKEIIQEQKDLAEDIKTVVTDLLALGVNTAVKLGTGFDAKHFIDELTRIKSTLDVEEQKIFIDLIAAQIEDNKSQYLENNAAPLVIGGAVAAYCAKNPTGCAKVIDKTAQALAALGIAIGMSGEEKKETHPKGVPSTSGNSATGMPPNGEDDKSQNDIGKQSKKMNDKQIAELVGNPRWHQTNLKSKIINAYRKELKGSKNFDFYKDPKSGNVYIKGNQSKEMIRINLEKFL